MASQVQEWNATGTINLKMMAAMSRSRCFHFCNSLVYSRLDFRNLLLKVVDCVDPGIQSSSLAVIDSECAVYPKAIVVSISSLPDS